MNIQERIKRLFRLRFAILYPLAVFVAVYSRATAASIGLGLCFIAPGVFLRLWSNSYAVKTEKLTTCGPYAFVRNPLYLGTLLILLGFVFLVQIYWVGIAALAAFTFAYIRTIGKEEFLLEDMYKDDYRAYKKAVPSFIPRFTPYNVGERWSFSFERLRRSKEHKIFIWIGVGIVGLYLKEKLMVEKAAFDQSMLALIILAVVLAALDLAEESWRKKDQGQS
ncbi:MAG: isoprenylcysteine carboxylmethyltransferase family protein [Candidatus Omnitrophica bacterium]|nr:isoprenylcysteine carboxylmethyltransferase family protein [Candidatus Omnitrophota bacterium]